MLKIRNKLNVSKPGDIPARFGLTMNLSSHFKLLYQFVPYSNKTERGRTKKYVFGLELQVEINFVREQLLLLANIKVVHGK